MNKDNNKKEFIVKYLSDISKIIFAGGILGSILDNQIEISLICSVIFAVLITITFKIKK